MRKEFVTMKSRYGLRYRRMVAVIVCLGLGAVLTAVGAQGKAEESKDEILTSMSVFDPYFLTRVYFSPSLIDRFVEVRTASDPLSVYDSDPDAGSAGQQVLISYRCPDRSPWQPAGPGG